MANEYRCTILKWRSKIDVSNSIALLVCSIRLFSCCTIFCLESQVCVDAGVWEWQHWDRRSSTERRGKHTAGWCPWTQSHRLQRNHGQPTHHTDVAGWSTSRYCMRPKVFFHSERQRRLRILQGLPEESLSLLSYYYKSSLVSSVKSGGINETAHDSSFCNMKWLRHMKHVAATSNRSSGPAYGFCLCAVLALDPGCVSV